MYPREPLPFSLGTSLLLTGHQQGCWTCRAGGHGTGQEVMPEGAYLPVGETGDLPGWERSTGEGTGYPRQYSWASLVAQLVRNSPAMQETWVQFLGWEDSLEKGKATHSSILA